MSASYLIQILLPKETGDGEPVSQEWFASFLKELTDKFGGATSFVRSPAQGLWRDGGQTERDNIAVVEVMAAKLASDYWRSMRERLERELSQEEIVIRAQEIIQL
jgi:hypothetical protein